LLLQSAIAFTIGKTPLRTPCPVHLEKLNAVNETCVSRAWLCHAAKDEVRSGGKNADNAEQSV
jgi:hypothetical protein